VWGDGIPLAKKKNDKKHPLYTTICQMVLVSVRSVCVLVFPVCLFLFLVSLVTYYVAHLFPFLLISPFVFKPLVFTVGSVSS